MCLAILKPAKASVTDDALRGGWIANSDGGGFAYIHKNKMVINKGFTSLKEFMASYKAASEKFSTSPFLIHFRIRSMGDKSVSNMHPFPVLNGSGALIHNGTISGTDAKYSTGESDTALFVAKYGASLDFDTITKHQKEWDDALGYNKVAILYNDSSYALINEKNGYWNNDVWYSNQSYKNSSSSRRAKTEEEIDDYYMALYGSPYRGD